MTIRSGYHSVDPWIISTDSDAEIAFLSNVFGARQRGDRVLNADGTIAHAEVDLRGSVVMLFDVPDDAERPTSALRVYVDDAASALDRATANGARMISRPTELAFGDVVARFRDPQGHLWWIHQQLADLTPDEMGARFADPVFQQNMAYMQQTLTDELAGRT